MNDKKLSKFLSLILRHKPETIGISLDKNGWADVAELIEKISKKGTSITFEILKQIVDKDEKTRYGFNSDFTKIRANQGHSLDIDLELEPVEPPEILYHGTIPQNLESIKKSGIHKGSRQYVHLSPDIETAKNVGQRRGKPEVLTIKSGQMHKDGIGFYCSENGVWLVESVEAKYVVCNEISTESQ